MRLVLAVESVSSYWERMRQGWFDLFGDEAKAGSEPPGPAVEFVCDAPQGFLALEGELTPILVHLVRSDKSTTEMLDTSDDANKIMAKSVHACGFLFPFLPLLPLLPLPLSSSSSFLFFLFFLFPLSSFLFPLLPLSSSSSSSSFLFFLFFLFPLSSFLFFLFPLLLLLPLSSSSSSSSFLFPLLPLSSSSSFLFFLFFLFPLLPLSSSSSFLFFLFPLLPLSSSSSFLFFLFPLLPLLPLSSSSSFLFFLFPLSSSSSFLFFLFPLLPLSSSSSFLFFLFPLLPLSSSSSFLFFLFPLLPLSSSSSFLFFLFFLFPLLPLSSSSSFPFFLFLFIFAIFKLTRFVFLVGWNVVCMKFLILIKISRKKILERLVCAIFLPTSDRISSIWDGLLVIIDYLYSTYVPVITVIVCSYMLPYLVIDFQSFAVHFRPSIDWVLLSRLQRPRLCHFLFAYTSYVFGIEADLAWGTCFCFSFRSFASFHSWFCFLCALVSCTFDVLE